MPRQPGLQLEHIDISSSLLVVSLIMTLPTATCPRCHRPSSRVRGRYRRTLADLPWGGLAVHLQLEVRKFACDHRCCPQRIFTERIPAIVQPYARRTARQVDLLRAVAFALGGVPGSRLLDRVRMAASASTLIRLIRRTPLPAPPAPRLIGVDDWARRKGRTYGSIVVDLERRAPIDLLPDRTAPTFAAWLAERPQIALISRDRAEAYADGATTGAPQAVQVADRWHIIQNLAAALDRALEQHGAAVTRAFVPPAMVLPVPETATEPASLATVSRPLPPEPAVQRSQRRRTARLERFETVRSLHQQGVSMRTIARHLGLGRDTVSKFVHATAFPERQPRAPRPSCLDPYKPYLLERWNSGCHHGVQLWREIAAQGYRGSRSNALAYISAIRKHQGVPGYGRPAHGTAPATDPSARPPTRRQLVWMVLRRPEKVTAAEQAHVAHLRTVDPAIDQAVQLAQEFVMMVRDRQPEALEPWLWRVANSDIAGLRSFAAGIQRDKAAVLNALRLPYSQGVVEGHVNRLKLIKRSGYGRAKFDLLRQRVLYAA